MLFGNNKKKKYIMGTTCTLLAVVTAATAVLATTQTAYAGATLPGVEKIIQDNSTENPFVILEVVPDKADAALGFLVEGEEPVDATGKSIKDMPSKEEREARFAEPNITADDKIGRLGIGSAISYEPYSDSINGVRSVDIRGVFTEAEEGGDYAAVENTEQYQKIQVKAEKTESPNDGSVLYKTLDELNDLELYRRYISLHKENEDTEADATRYKIKLSVLEDTESLPIEFVAGENAVVGEDDPVLGAYNHQYFVITDDEIMADEVNNYLGELIFRKTSTSEGLEYIGVLTQESSLSLMMALPTEDETETGTETETETETEAETETESGTETETESESESGSTEGNTTEDPTSGSGSTEGNTTEESTSSPGSTEGNSTEDPTSGSGSTEGNSTENPTLGPGSTEASSPESTNENTDAGDSSNADSGGGEEEEPSGEEYSDLQAYGFTTKQMRRMSINIDELNFIEGATYVVVKEADGSDANATEYYYISDVEEDADADMVAFESYNKYARPEGGYTDEYIGETFYLKKDGILPYEYSVDEYGVLTGTHRFTADYTQEIYDTVPYEGGFTNEEWFKKYVFNLDEDQYDDMCIDVVPVTLDELNENPDLLAKADLIYFSDIANRGFPELTTEVTEEEQTKNRETVTFTFDGTLEDTSGKYSIDLMWDNAFDPKPHLDNPSGKLDMERGGYVNVNMGDFFKTAEEISISFKMQVDDPDNNPNWVYFIEPNPIYTKEMKGTNEQKYLYERYLGLLQQGGNITAERYYNPSESKSKDREGSVSASYKGKDWTDVTVVYDTGQTRLYVGKVGEVEPVCEKSTVDISDILSSNISFRLGRGNWKPKNASIVGEYYNGMIEDFSISNYAVDEEDSLYNSIIEKVTEGVPIVLNRSLLEKGNNEQLKKMAALLMQRNITSSNVSIDSYNLDSLKQSMIQPMSDGTQAFVNGNVYIYDDVNMGQVVSSKFADGSFYSNEQINNGFSDVIAEIENENFYLELAGKTERINPEVTMATAIRHIINHEDKRNTTKTSLRVLDLEPYDFERYYLSNEGNDPTILDVYEDIKKPGTNYDERVTVKRIETDSICITEEGKLDKTEWISTYLAEQFKNDPNQLDVTIMGTKEFVGKLNDLNAEYDLIYLGMDTSIMNTKIENDIKTDETCYNNSDMNGLVYTHVGDTIRVKTLPRLDAKINGDYCLSGNDITKDKLRELSEFIEAGYAVIVSDEMLLEQDGKYSVNTKKIDAYSNMYKLLQYTVLKDDGAGGYKYFGKNVNSKRNLENNKSAQETFNKYLGISKLVVTPLEGGLPTEYNQPGGKQGYLSADANGVYWLRYDVFLTNDAAVGASSTTYDCQLYVDIDADGRYEEGETLSGLTITDDNGNVQGIHSDGRFHLSADDVYHISRDVPEGYTGFLAWKLMFTQNDRTYSDTDETAVVRTALTGYSAVPCTGVRPEIRILQITNVNGKTNLDLASNEMQSLYAGVQDFTIRVTKISSSDYIGKNGFTEMSYSEYLNGFDMVVMGFVDMYRFGNKSDGGMYDEPMIIDATLAIREYALSGRSIMFTHDLNSSIIDDTTDKGWGYYFNRYLRDIQGMDRFGEVKASGVITEAKHKYDSLYDEYSLENFLKDKESKSVTKALVNPVILSNEYKHEITRNIYGENARRASWQYSLFWNYKENHNGWHTYNSHVEQVNKGQITEYPYKIEKEFEITQSHPQYFQLNLDTDNRDANENDDIVVWYTLGHIPDWSDSFFAATEKDVRNNYFIYNKGNVTYTGSGDNTINSEMECKLFVNTLVTSYRAGMQAPRALFKENSWQTSATVMSKYIPYDPNMTKADGAENETGAFLDNLEVHFYTTNPNLRKSNEDLYAKYYIEVTSSEHYDLHTNDKYYKEIQPVKMYRMVTQDNTGVPQVVEDVSRLSNNTMYTMELSYDEIGFGTTQDIRKDYTSDLYVRLSYEPIEDAQGNAEVSLSAAESMSKLELVCVQLFELK